jgi:uncharacterized membrane protein affecting hemolysin expression
MRYRIGETPASGTSTDDMLLFTVVISLIVGIVLTWLARRGRQRWLSAWSIGLILVSIAYLGWATTAAI